MFLVEGSYKNKEISNARYGTTLFSVGIYSKDIHITSSSSDRSYKYKLSDIISVDVVGQEFQTSKGGGIKGAGAGAVLGFLVAGPIGTAVGAGLGSRSKKVGRDNTTISIGFINGDYIVCDYVKTQDIGQLKSALAINLSRPKKIDKVESPKKLATEKIKKKKAKRIKAPSRDLSKHKLIKGRNPKRKLNSKNQPPLEVFGKISELNNDDLLHKNLLENLDGYHLFIWSYFDAEISSDEEVSEISARVLQNIFILSGQKNIAQSEIKRLDNSLIETKNNLDKFETQLKDAEINLRNANFLTKRRSQDEVTNIRKNIEDEKKYISFVKRKKTIANKQLKELGDLINISSLSNKIKNLNKIISPQNKLNSKLKKTKKLNDQFFLDTFISAFNKYEDKRVAEEQALYDKEYSLKISEQNKKAKDNKKNIKSQIASTDKPIKKRLTELKELLDEGVLEKDEYEIQRKRILESI